jgi:hypothetical protein
LTSFSSFFMPCSDEEAQPLKNSEETGRFRAFSAQKEPLIGLKRHPRGLSSPEQTIQKRYSFPSWKGGHAKETTSLHLERMPRLSPGAQEQLRKFPTSLPHSFPWVSCAHHSTIYRFRSWSTIIYRHLVRKL